MCVEGFTTSLYDVRPCVYCVLWGRCMLLAALLYFLSVAFVILELMLWGKRHKIVMLHLLLMEAWNGGV